MPLDLFNVGEPIADTKAPTDVPIGERWSERQFRGRLVNPANRRKMTIIVVGTGLAGGSAAATLGEAGYKVGALVSAIGSPTVNRSRGIAGGAP